MGLDRGLHRKINCSTQNNNNNVLSYHFMNLVAVACVAHHRKVIHSHIQFFLEGGSCGVEC
jgi:hypothetical protein